MAGGRFQYKPAKPTIEDYFAQNGIAHLGELSPQQFHSLYESLMHVVYGGVDTKNDVTEEQRRKKLLLAHIKNSFGQFAPPPGSSFVAAALVRESTAQCARSGASRATVPSRERSLAPSGDVAKIAPVATMAVPKSTTSTTGTDSMDWIAKLMAATDTDSADPVPGPVEEAVMPPPVPHSTRPLRGCNKPPFFEEETDDESDSESLFVTDRDNERRLDGSALLPSPEKTSKRSNSGSLIDLGEETRISTPATLPPAETSSSTAFGFSPGIAAPGVMLEPIFDRVLRLLAEDNILGAIAVMGKGIGMLSGILESREVEMEKVQHAAAAPSSKMMKVEPVDDEDL